MWGAANGNLQTSRLAVIPLPTISPMRPKSSIIESVPGRFRLSARSLRGLERANDLCSGQPNNVIVWSIVTPYAGVLSEVVRGWLSHCEISRHALASGSGGNRGLVPSG